MLKLNQTTFYNIFFFHQKNDNIIFKVSLKEITYQMRNAKEPVMLHW